jgi:uncharacterized GH25 family protein
MNTSTIRWALIVIAFLPGASFAARGWVLPSQTVLANSGGFVTFDAAMSDDLFSFAQGAMALDSLVVTSPDGKPVEAQNVSKGKTRSSFDLELRATGTYRVAIASDLLMARWEEDGKPKRWRGIAAEMATGIPAAAEKLEVEQMQRRVETFVSVGTPSAIKPAGVGLELAPIQHPNDLYAGETTKFRFLLDGKPARDLEVEILASGNRYRDTPNEVKYKTDKDGVVAIQWPVAGLYWLEAEVADENATAPKVKKRRATYNGTFEVLTQ